MATTGTFDGPRGGFLSRLAAASRPSRLALGVAILSVISGMATYALLTGLVPYRPTSTTLIVLMLVNLALVLTLGALIAWRLTRLWSERRSGIAGARLHVRLVAMFAAIAVIPAILVAVFAAVTLNLGVEAWFSTRVQAALNSAISVADAYVTDHGRMIIADAREIAASIEQDPQLFDADNHVRPDVLFTRLQALTKDHSLQASYIINSQGAVLGSTKQKSLPDMKLPTAADIRAASKGTIVIDANSSLGVVRALIRLQALNDAYLLVVRAVDPEVLGYYQRTRDAVSEYKRLDRNRSDVQLVFATLYGIVSLLILLVAVWLGIWAAKELVNPISRLIGAAERVTEGDLKAQVRIDREDDELGVLGRAFNRMTSQLLTQRNELVEASHQIDGRRRFMEAVLSGVSAGVIGLDGDGNITLVNRAAARLLNAAPEEMEGRHYAEAMPELAALIRRAVSEPIGRASGEATVKRAGATQTLSVQVDSDSGGGFVLTFDDITDLVSAQRTAAWADVARRIAHEIKNPLTPIQLSAERLKRKYSREIESDPEVFAQCTDTIIRQVGDIGRMVDEFSSFARMPAPVMRLENFQGLLQQSVFLQRVGNPQIVFDVQAPREPVRVVCDGRLISQALTNVLKNAGEAIAGRHDKGDDTPGHVAVTLTADDGRACLTVTDNGIGLPAEHKNRLTEPYVTTRAKGTGLGLAIVRKIVEDHGGEITLTDREDDMPGAVVRLVFPLAKRAPHVVEMEDQDEQERIADSA